jgi:hypothetical protein
VGSKACLSGRREDSKRVGWISGVESFSKSITVKC